MRLNAWHTALTLSVTAHAAALGFGAAWPNAAAPGQSVPEQVRLTVVTVPQVSHAAAQPRVASRAIPDVAPHMAVRPDPTLPETPPVPAVPAAAVATTVSRATIVAARMTQRPPPGPSLDVPPDTTSEHDASAAAAGAVVDSAPAMPVPGGNPPPRYPRRARRRGWEGAVLLDVQVTAEGMVDTISVTHSSGHAVLDRAAVEAVGRWRFSPARVGGLALVSAVRVPVIFRLEDALVP